jgi:hypothetical protein
MKDLAVDHRRSAGNIIPTSAANILYEDRESARRNTVFSRRPSTRLILGARRTSGR